MNRLGVRLVLAFVAMTLTTVALMSVPQLRAIAAERHVLPESERPVFTPSLLRRALLVRGTDAYDRPFAAILRFAPAAATGNGGAEGGVAEGETQATPQAAGQDGEGTVSRRAIVAFLRTSLERRALVLIGSASVALAFAVGLGLLLARLIARPVEQVTRAADHVANGDLTVRIPVPHGGADGSETSRLALSFNAMADSLERSERNRKDMVADIAHELRTPLTVLRGRLEAMEDGIAPIDHNEIRDLHGQVLMLARLVEDLRMLSLADAGALSLEVREFDLAELARTVAAGYQVRARDRGIDLRVETPVEPPTTAGRATLATTPSPPGDPAFPAVPTVGDPDRLTQVMVNLLDNALRHTPRGGVVTMVVTDAPGGPRLDVADSGPGIPEGAEQRIFDRFVRTDDGRARTEGGSGLGLAIVNAIVALHHGTVRAWNAAAGGAVFSVQLVR